MHYAVTVYGFLLFGISLIVHVIIWRIYHPKHQIISLFGLFLLTPVLCISLIHNLYGCFLIRSEIIGTFSVLTGEQKVQVYLLYSALSLAYVFSYPAAQARCPTFAILLIIKSSMPRGATRDEILSCFTQEEVMGPRVHDLINETLIVHKEGWLKLSRKGRILITVFGGLRKLAALPMGRG